MILQCSAPPKRKPAPLSRLTPPRKIALSFASVILAGAILLTLPVSNAPGTQIAFLDALFTAASATCVTGLSTVVPVEQFSLFGQFVLILLMQTGGLGLMTIMAIFTLRLRSRLSLNEKIAVRELMNCESLSNMKGFIFSIFRYTFVLEGLGALVFLFVFVPRHGLWKGLFQAVFIAVSAFCNAGFDVVGASSLIPYAENPAVNFTVMALVVLGGIGFVVWQDVRQCAAQAWKRKLGLRRLLSSLHLHTKLVLVTTTSLLLGGAMVFFFAECSSAGTLGELPLPSKLMASLFQSTTLRTAGFATVNCGELRQISQFFMILMMFIGGSPGGTAGGIKTTTFAVLLLTVWGSLKGKETITAFQRVIPREAIRRSLTVLSANAAALVGGVFLLCITEPFSFLELLFEAASALATVGLSLGITPGLTPFGKLVIIALMYIGRIGMVTLLVSFFRQKKEADARSISYPRGNVIVG